MKAVRLLGGSMRPLLSSGEPSLLEPVPVESVRPGDLVAYRVQGRRLVHRAAWRGRRGLWVFDDGAVVGWHRVAPEAVEGRIAHPSPLARGLPGLLYGLAVWSLYSLRKLLP